MGSVSIWTLDVVALEVGRWTTIRVESRNWYWNPLSGPKTRQVPARVSTRGIGEGESTTLDMHPERTMPKAIERQTGGMRTFERMGGSWVKARSKGDSSPTRIIPGIDARL
jgi:hypothetical protein